MSPRQLHLAEAEQRYPHNSKVCGNVEPGNTVPEDVELDAMNIGSFVPNIGHGATLEDCCEEATESEHGDEHEDGNVDATEPPLNEYAAVEKQDGDLGGGYADSIQKRADPEQLQRFGQTIYVETECGSVGRTFRDMVKSSVVVVPSGLPNPWSTAVTLVSLCLRT